MYLKENLHLLTNYILFSNHNIQAWVTQIVLPSTWPEMFVVYVMQYCHPPFQQSVNTALTCTATPPKMVYNWSNPWQELSTGWFLCDICQSYCQLLCLMPHIKAMVEMFKWFCFCELYKETQTYQYTNPINGIIFWDLWNFIYIYNYIYPENNIFIDFTKEGYYVPASIRYNFPDYQGRLVH